MTIGVSLSSLKNERLAALVTPCCSDLMYAPWWLWAEKIKSASVFLMIVQELRKRLEFSQGYFAMLPSCMGPL